MGKGKIKEHKKTIEEQIEVEDDEAEKELEALGLPKEFSSSKGKQIQKNPVEAHRIGQVRKYQRILRKKMQQWQIERVKGMREKTKKEIA